MIPVNVVENKKSISAGWKLAIAIFVCEAVGIVSGFIAAAGREPWFSTLQKPTWNPPSYLFAPVWTILYLLMAVAFWLIWKNETSENNKRPAYLLFGLQLLLNFCWSILFFNVHSPFLALIDILLLDLLIILTIWSFTKISTAAAWLMLPYLAWVTFASFLNYAFWNLNS